MLKQLRISNIILIETAEIDFAEGFNVLSGETGSGKSAIMHAISLIRGDRAEINLLRKGAEKGIVEAIFDIKGISGIETVLEQGGIDFEQGDDLYIRREISSVGKSRAFINNQLAQLSLLRAVCSRLIHIVGQHANQELFSIERHRDILDLFGSFKGRVAEFSLSYDQEHALNKELENLINSEAQRLREMEVCQMIIDELDEAHLKEGEDEELFHEYSLLSHAEEIKNSIYEICKILQGEKGGVLSQLQRQKGTFDKLVFIDPKLSEVAVSFQNAVLELHEIANGLNIYQSRLEHNPERLAEVNERLAWITRLKKKYGSTWQEIQTFLEETTKRRDVLQNADHKIEELRKNLDLIKHENNERALQLSKLRIQAAQELSALLKKELCTLNMPNVDFQIDVTAQKRSRHGDDRIEFFLLPNRGEHRIPIKDCASGGELSRVMLALQTVMCGREGIATLVFDEVDGNIGGETAKVVGDKLKKIGNKQQVICITHFPQVAKQADYHVQISKEVIGDRTLTLIQVLNKKSREQELARMSGTS